MEQMGANTAPFGQPRFGRAPKALDVVDVNSASSGKHIVPVMDAVVLAIVYVHQPIIVSPAIRVDDAAARHLSPQNGLQGALFHIGDDLRVDFPIPFVDAKDNRFASGAAAPLPLDATRAEGGFVHFGGATQGRVLFTRPRDSLADRQKVPVDGVPVEPCEVRHFGCLQIQGKQTQELAKLMGRKMGMADVSIFPRHDWLV